jgi:Rgp1
VSYDVNKDGVQIAVLTFTKSAYRLGETVLCVVDLNERKGRSKVLKVGDNFCINMFFFSVDVGNLVISYARDS